MDERRKGLQLSSSVLSGTRDILVLRLAAAAVSKGEAADSCCSLRDFVIFDGAFGAFVVRATERANHGVTTGRGACVLRACGVSVARLSRSFHGLKYDGGALVGNLLFILYT